MKCLKVAVNGKKICTAGVTDGLLMSSVEIWLDRAKRRKHIILTVRGLTEKRGRKEHLDWGGLIRLSVGDVVTVKIVAAAHADEPTEREREKKR